MNYRAVPSLLLSLSLLPVLLPILGCDKAAPEAPAGSILAISANPTRIALNGQSVITIIGRQPDGNPLNPGTEILLSATLGSITTLVTTDRSGMATATFRSDGEQGTATITASTGSGGTTTGGGTTSDSSGSSSGVLTTSISIPIGVPAGPSAASIILQPTPTSLTSSGGTVSLLAVVRDQNGQPLANQGVNFSADLGSLRSKGATVQTNASGVAKDTLTLTAGDLSNNASTVTVNVQTVGSDGKVATATSMVHIQGSKPVASFSFSPGSTAQEVQFIDTSTSQGALSYSWNFGDGASSSEQNPSHLYASPGSYTVVLTVTDTSSQSSTATARITVPVTTPGTSGLMSSRPSSRR
jgi:PKD domain/Bacterial Ig-like domain (group 1)